MREQEGKMLGILGEVCGRVEDAAGLERVSKVSLRGVGYGG